MCRTRHCHRPGGAHPFGATFERDYNILSGRPNLSALSHWPEAVNLIGAMVNTDPKRRPSIAAVKAHPMWWLPQHALLFLIQVACCELLAVHVLEAHSRHLSMRCVLLAHPAPWNNNAVPCNELNT